MQLTCPHCQFSKEVPVEKIPNTSTKVSCPKCKESFPLTRYNAEERKSVINCPVCHTEQPELEACSSCGLIFARYHETRQTRPATAEKTLIDPTGQSKAGFWLRLVALMIDCFLVFMMQLIFGILLVFAGDFKFTGSISILIQLFSMILSVFYWVFFTGYCGQTPGKMLLRIKVIRTDGETLNYGKAFYREVVGKFISGIIFCIGYLMAAFDDQKQCLHDRMARTFVVKL